MKIKWNDDEENHRTLSFDQSISTAGTNSSILIALISFGFSPRSPPLLPNARMLRRRRIDTAQIIRMDLDKKSKFPHIYNMMINEHVVRVILEFLSTQDHLNKEESEG